MTVPILYELSSSRQNITSQVYNFNIFILSLVIYSYYNIICYRNSLYVRYLDNTRILLLSEDLRFDYKMYKSHR